VSVTAEDRIARALAVGQRWVQNLEGQAVRDHAEWERTASSAHHNAAQRSYARARDIRDLLAILDGSEDVYIAHLLRQEG
jgi:hypothetical protein